MATQEQPVTIESLQAEILLKDQEIARLTRERDQALEEANTDPLTGIPNHRAFNSVLSREYGRVVRAQKRQESQAMGHAAPPLAIIEWDIDHFKLINDLGGHQAGDFLLTDFAKTLQMCLREADFCSRKGTGSDEFYTIAPETSLEQARQLAKRIVKYVEQNLRIKGHPTLRPTVSFGVAELLSGESIEEFLDRADAELYKSKKDKPARLGSVE